MFFNQKHIPIPAQIRRYYYGRKHKKLSNQLIALLKTF
jgi:hypothetical protein